MGPSPATQFAESFSTPLESLYFWNLPVDFQHLKKKQLGGRMQIDNRNIDNKKDTERLKVQIKLSELLQVAKEANICTLK